MGEEHGRAPVQLVETSVALFLLGARLGGAGVEWNPGTLGQRLERLSEVDLVDLHHEVERIAPRAAAEAVVVLALGEDDERRGLFLVEGAEPLKIRACLTQVDVLTDQLNDVGPVTYLLDGIAAHGLPHTDQKRGT